MARSKKEETHPCSSCDEEVPISTMSNEGRCERCELEYPLDEYDEDED